MDVVLEIAKMWGPIGVIVGLYVYDRKADVDNKRADIESRVLMATALSGLKDTIEGLKEAR